MSNQEWPFRLYRIRGVDPKGRFPANSVSAQSVIDAHGIEFARSAVDCLVAIGGPVNPHELADWLHARGRKKP